MIEVSCVDEIASDQSFDRVSTEYSLYRIPGMPAPYFNYDYYKSVENTGMFTAWRALREGRLIGFMTMFTSIVPHYSAQISVVESLFVSKDFRRYGDGLRFIKEAEKYGKNIGSVALFINSPFGTELEAVLRRKKFTLETLKFFKCLTSS